MKAFEDIYVVGCGPSMKTFSWDCLRPFTTIAINGAIQNVPSPWVFLTACSGFLKLAVAQKFWHTAARKVMVIGPEHKNYHNIRSYLPLFDDVIHPARFDGEIGFEWSQFATGQNSGFCGMQYAVLLGARRIHLVGFDLGGKGHYYGAGGPPARELDMFLTHFCTGIRILQSRGIEVISRTSVSRLNDIIPYKELESGTDADHRESLHSQDGL